MMNPLRRSYLHELANSRRDYWGRGPNRLCVAVSDRLRRSIRARSTRVAAVARDHPALPSLNGTLMELEDCAFPLLADVKATDKAEEAFDGADWVILVGGLPRKEGQSRADLIRANSQIFTGQGKAINSAAGPNVRILAVANPCNTNCLIARSHAPKVPADRWFAMTRLDQNRAAALLAKKAVRTRERRLMRDDLGQPQRHSVPRLQERQDPGQAGDPGD